MKGGPRVTREVREALQVRRKLSVLSYIKEIGNVQESCRDLGVPRSSFYRWRKAFAAHGKEGLVRRRPIARSHPRQIPPEYVEKILHLRCQYHLGPQRIAWYLERYHGFRTSCSSVYRTLKRQGIGPLPRKVLNRTMHSRRYAKQVPGHHIQIDVKFLALVTGEGRRVRRYQYTAIDDATRVRALKIYRRHNQQSSIDFMDYVIEKFPFRIHTVRTDRGHEWQAKFHWHVEDAGIRHVYIKARTPQLNGKVERSHRTDQEEFYQLLTYTDDVDLNGKLAQWETFYNLNRPHTAHRGKSPYEVMKSLLQ
jgi:transposase InsO family protein